MKPDSENHETQPDVKSAVSLDAFMAAVSPAKQIRVTV